MFKEGRRGLRAIGMSLSIVLMASCGTKTATNTAVPEESAPVDPELSKRMDFIAANRAQISKVLMQEAAPQGFSQLLQERLVASLERSEQRKTDKSLPMDLRYDDVMQKYYETRSFAPVLLDGSELSDAARILYSEVLGLKRHLLDEASYPLARLQDAVKALEGTNPKDMGGLTLTPEEERSAALLMIKHGLDVNSPNVSSRLAWNLVGEDGLNSVKKRFFARAQALADHAKEAVEMELLLMDSWLKLARDLSLNNMNALSDDEQEFIGKKPTEAKFRELLYQRLAKHIETLGQALQDGAAATQTVVHSVYPPHQQYELLLQAYANYQAMVDAGGWETLKKATVRFGKSSAVAKTLKERLAKEGYYQGVVDENADDALKSAVLRYKQTHQMEENDEMPLSFWKSLNISANERLQQIGENIKRWHSTYLIPSDYYIFINIPDFYAEMWRDGTLQMRFPVVVGNAKRECNPETKRMEYVNATPLQRARMQYVEYNPYWNVPPRIEQEEYLPKMHEDPQWLQKNGYEYYTDGGHTVLRQLPGDNNALGRVKFIFPNEHSVFLHDSPLKGLFRYPTRAFSHGCMRVWEPMKLAQVIVQNDGQWHDGLDKELEDLKPRRVVLKNRFDVFSDYYTVRVDEVGSVHFLADPYRYVGDAIDPPRKQRDCKPAQKVKLARPNADGSLPVPEGLTEDVGTEMIPLE